MITVYQIVILLRGSCIEEISPEMILEVGSVIADFNKKSVIAFIVEICDEATAYSCVYFLLYKWEFFT
jgi:hypothetical protein